MTTMKLAGAMSALILFATAATSVEARVRYQPSDLPAYDRAGGGSEIGSRMFIRDAGVRRFKTAGLKQIRKRFKRSKSAHRKYNSAVVAQSRREQSSSSATQIVAHPSGCPRSAFCGCGVALEVFGRHVRDLWLAANWYRFPRAQPAPGMVAVRRHHVFVIREVRGSGMVLAYDPNSGGRRTRIHLRSLSGFTVVNPHGGSRYATAG